MTDNVFYFAYGSNMSSHRLTQRLPKATKLGVILLSQYALRFHKPGSIDGTGKCNAYFTGNPDDVVWGVIYRIGTDELEQLNVYEGLGQGYDLKQHSVTLDGKPVTICFYIATILDETIKPFHWYKEHVVRGAREHNLPSTYIESILQIESIDDGDIERHKHELLIYQ